MLRLCSVLFLLLCLAAPAQAAVELALGRGTPVTIEEVYLRDDVSYLALEDVLPPLGLRGRWDSVAHVYRLRTPRGAAVISPGSHFLRLGERFIPLEHPPRFIDGRLRVPESFVSRQLPSLLDQSVYFRNLTPSAVETGEGDSALDRLFAFLLRKKTAAEGAALRAVAIDPGHGGQDPGSIGPGGVKEKTVALEVARLLEKQVKMRLGIPVFLSRDGDYSLTPKKRLEPATRPEVDALILLHAQSSLSPDPHGVTLMVRPREESGEDVSPAGEGESMRLARRLTEAFRASDLKVAGIVRAPLLPLGRGDLPTVLVELGYLSNPVDGILLRSQAGQERLAAALFEGLKAFSDEQKEVVK